VHNGYNVPRERLRAFVGTQGVDVIFDRLARVLKIPARYSHCLAQSDVVANTLRQGCGNLLQPRDQIPNNLVSSIVPGTFFMREGVLLEVISINGNNVIVEEAEGNSYRFSLDINDAAQLINNYIS
jgi:hypothetical protein